VTAIAIATWMAHSAAPATNAGHAHRAAGEPAKAPRLPVSAMQSNRRETQIVA
jgi:hypothetical protein